MNEEAWRRHANPWSVVTRFLAIPAFILAVWSRVWIGEWALGPVALVALWLWLNPRVFSPVSGDSSWAAKGIYGERLWLEHRSQVPRIERQILGLLIGIGLVGFGCIGWGLLELEIWPTILGTVLVVMAQLWRIDRMGMLFDRVGYQPGATSGRSDTSADSDSPRHEA